MNKTLSLFAALSVMAGPASAVPINVDEVIFQNGAGLNSSQLLPSISMTLSGNTLTIHLTNLSPDSAGDGALVMFTGLAFQLPFGITVDASNNNGGSVAANGTTSAGWTDPDNAWGWDNNDAGLSGGALAYATLSGYNTRVSTIASDGKFAFDGTGNAGGMDYGIFGLAESSIAPAPWVKNELIISLNLTNIGDASIVLTAINAGNVAAIFGSPAGTPQDLPEPGTLALLGLGLGLAGLGFARRRKAA